MKHSDGFFGNTSEPPSVIRETKMLQAGFDHPCKGICSGWQQGFERAVLKCVEEVKGWKELHELSHKTITDQKGWKNQEDADREHGNTIRLLDCIISQMRKIK